MTENKVESEIKIISFAELAKILNTDTASVEKFYLNLKDQNMWIKSPVKPTAPKEKGTYQTIHSRNSRVDYRVHSVTSKQIPFLQQEWEEIHRAENAPVDQISIYDMAAEIGVLPFHIAKFLYKVNGLYKIVGRDRFAISVFVDKKNFVLCACYILKSDWEIIKKHYFIGLAPNNYKTRSEVEVEIIKKTGIRPSSYLFPEINFTQHSKGNLGILGISELVTERIQRYYSPSEVEIIIKVHKRKIKASKKNNKQLNTEDENKK